MSDKQYDRHTRSISKTRVLARTLALLKPHPILTTCVATLIILNVASTMLSPIIVKRVIDTVQQSIQNDIISRMPLKIDYLLQNPLLIQLSAIALLSALSMFLGTIILQYFIQKIIIDLRTTTIAHALRQSMRYFSNEPIGTMVTRLTNDLDSTGMFLQTMIQQIFASIISLIGITVALFIINPWFTLTLSAALPFIIIIAELYRRKILSSAQKLRDNRGALNSYTAEHLQGATDLQIYNKAPESIMLFNTMADSYYSARYTLGFYQTFIRPFMNLFLAMLIFIIIISGTYFARAGLATVGTIIAFVQLAENFFNPLITLAQNITQIQESIAGIERVFAFLSHSDELPSARLAASPSAYPAASAPQNTTLTCNHISFGYKPGQKIIHDVSFCLEPDKRIALVGYSGAGKSTIARLCVRFWDVDSGNITLGERDIHTIPLPVLRTTVRLLQQDSFIFDGTLRENLTMGKDVSAKQLNDLADKSGLGSIVSSLPGGWNGHINASTLSTGEQRLIAICRVFLDAPPVLILDEFSAALDNDTEQAVQDLLHQLQHGRASIIIAHRLNTIKTCDEILYLENGSISERGTHDALYAQDCGYARLVKNMRKTVHEIAAS